MKKLMILAMMVAIATSAAAMTYREAKREALFLADKMAYELNLTDEQYEAAYEINLDYLMAVDSRSHVYGDYWARRNRLLRTVFDPLAVQRLSGRFLLLPPALLGRKCLAVAYLQPL